MSASKFGNKGARLQDILRQSPIVAVITIDSAQDAVPLARALVEGGVTALEITLRTSVALAAARTGGAGVQGAGRHDSGARRSGCSHRWPAHFGGAPASRRRWRLPPHDRSSGYPVASELMQAVARGFDVLKLFPAASLGRSAVQAYAGPFPEVRFCPTGGVGEDNFMDWLALPNVVAVGGSWVAAKTDVRAGKWQSITDCARRATDKIRAKAQAQTRT
jgi:2-dehydro-3-deoxyphosphogluconate aldolase/(4S)-4-hydroxy-2-oxoglutarate aldolase